AGPGRLHQSQPLDRDAEVRCGAGARPVQDQVAGGRLHERASAIHLDAEVARAAVAAVAGEDDEAATGCLHAGGGPLRVDAVVGRAGAVAAGARDVNAAVDRGYRPGDVDAEVERAAVEAGALHGDGGAAVGRNLGGAIDSDSVDVGGVAVAG